MDYQVDSHAGVINLEEEERPRVPLSGLGRIGCQVGVRPEMTFTPFHLFGLFDFDPVV